MERYPDLLAQGFSRSDIDSRVRNQELRRIRRGVFVASTRPETPEGRHLELLAATIPHLAKSAVLSHSSAGVLHDLPVPLTTLDRIHITRSSGGRISRHTYRHEAPLPSGSLTEIKGYQVTSLARTVVDLARWLEYADGVAVVDAALRQGVHREELLVEIERARRRHGNVRAREAVVFGDGRAESPGESRSRVMMARLGLPMPNLQKELCNE